MMMTYRSRGARGMQREGPPRDTEPNPRGQQRREYDPYSPPMRAQARRRPNYDDELISKTLHVDQKKFYIDLKENSFGKFIKIIESNQNRGNGRNRVIIPQELFQEFIDVLTTYVEVLEKNESLEGADNGPTDSSERMQTQRITNERKTLYIDLRKNSRGKFLKVTEQSPRNGEERTQVIVPTEGLEVLRDVIAEILRVASPPARQRDPREQRRDPRVERERRPDPRGERADRGERGERTDRGERGERADRGERGERADRGERGERTDRGERGERREGREGQRERRGELREYREPPRERRDQREKEPRERNRRPPRREAETSPALLSESAVGPDTEPKAKPAPSNPTANPSNPEETESSSIDETLPATIEVRSERKIFYFDARRNDMGVFLQVSEVGEVTRKRRRHINIPHMSWQSCHRAMETMLEQLPYEPPEQLPVSDAPVPPDPSEEKEVEPTEPVLSPPAEGVSDKPEDSKTESS